MPQSGYAQFFDCKVIASLGRGGDYFTVIANRRAKKKKIIVQRIARYIIRCHLRIFTHPFPPQTAGKIVFAEDGRDRSTLCLLFAAFSAFL